MVTSDCGAASNGPYAGLPGEVCLTVCSIHGSFLGSRCLKSPFICYPIVAWLSRRNRWSNERVRLCWR
jgi:hypothetical protein